MATKGFWMSVSFRVDSLGLNKFGEILERRGRLFVCTNVNVLERHEKLFISRSVLCLTVQLCSSWRLRQTGTSCRGGKKNGVKKTAGKIHSAQAAERTLLPTYLYHRLTWNGKIIEGWIMFSHGNHFDLAIIGCDLYSWPCWHEVLSCILVSEWLQGK